MQIIGTMVDVQFDQQIAKQNGGFYQGARFSYRDQAGALKEQNFTNQSLKFNPTIKNALGQLKAGDVFTMVKEKEGDFWNVKGIYGEGGAPSQAPSAGTTKAPLAVNPSPKSNYETPEERAKKQVYIVRQSSLSAAVAMLDAAGDKKTPINPDTVIGVAKQFEAYVFGTKFDDSSASNGLGSIMSLESDDIDVD